METKFKLLVIGTGITIILGLLIYSLSVFFSTEFMIKKCENLLKSSTPDGLIRTYPQKICKVTGNFLKKKVQEIQPNDIVKPGDQIIISVNFPEVLAKFQNIFTGESIQKPKNNFYPLCFVIYPNLQLGKYLKADTISAFYRNYFWEITPENILNLSSKNNNYICTNTLPFESYSNISVLLTIPSQEFLKLGGANARSYGTEIVFIPETNIGVKDALKNVSLDAFSVGANNILPIYLYLKTITLQ